MKRIVKKLERQSKEKNWVDNYLEIHIGYTKKSKKGEESRRRNSTIRRSSITGNVIDFSRFKKDDNRGSLGSSGRFGKFEVDLSAFKDMDVSNETGIEEEVSFEGFDHITIRDTEDRDFEEVYEEDEEEDNEQEDTKDDDANGDTAKVLDQDENETKVEDKVNEIKASEEGESDVARDIEVDEANGDNQIEKTSEENPSLVRQETEREDSKIIEGLGKFIEGGDVHKIKEEISKKEKEEQAKKEEIRKREEKEKKIKALKAITVEDIDRMIESRERASPNHRSRSSTKMSIRSPLKAIADQVKRTGFVMQEVEVQSDSDYSFDTDKEEDKVVEDQEDEEEKQEKKYNRFGEEVELVFDNLSKVYQAEIEDIKKPVEEQMKANLHFSMVKDEDAVPNFKKKNVTFENLYNVVEKKYGKIYCLKGNKKSSVFLFGLMNNKLVKYNVAKDRFLELKTSDKKYPTCFEFSDEYGFFAAGYNKGEIAIFQDDPSDLKNPHKRVLRLTDLDVLKIPVLCIKVLNKLRAMLACLQDGRLFYLERKDTQNKLSKMSFKFRLVEKGLGYTSIPNLAFKNFRGIDFAVQTLGHTARVYVHKYSNKYKGMQKVSNLVAPEGESSKTLESFPFFDEVTSDGAPLKVICIHWKSDICYYPMYYGKGDLHIPLGGRYPLAIKVEYSCQFDGGVFPILTNTGEIYHYFIHRHVADEKYQMDKKLREVTKQDYEGELTQGGQLPFANVENNEIFMEIEVTDEEAKKNESQIVVKSPYAELNNDNLVFVSAGEKKVCSSFFNVANSELTILTKSSFISYSMINWIEYLKSCIDHGEIFFAMKTLNEILDLKMISLSSIPKDIEMIAQDIRPMFSFLIVKIWTQAQNFEEEKKKQISKISMLLLLKAGMENFLLENLKTIMEGFRYSSYYYENLNLFYLNNMIKNIEESFLLGLLEEFKLEPMKRKKLLYHSFTNDGLQEFSLQQALVNRYYTLMIHFCANDDPGNSSLALNTIATDIVELYLKEKMVEASNAIYSIFDYIFKICISMKKEGNLITKRDHQWMVLTWLYDVRMAQELIKVDIVKYLECIKFLIKKDIGDELDKLEGGMEFIEKNQIEKYGILSEDSSVYLCYLLDNLYKVTENNEIERTIFHLFLASLILSDHKHKIKVSNDFVVKTVHQLFGHYKEIDENDRVEISSDEVIMLAMSIFLRNKQLFINDQILLGILEKKE